MEQVPPTRLQYFKTIHARDFLMDKGGVAELSAGCRTSLFEPHTAGDIVFGLSIEIELNILSALLISRCSSKVTAKAHRVIPQSVARSDRCQPPAAAISSSQLRVAFGRQG
jgi:hypothetical protein